MIRGSAFKSCWHLHGSFSFSFESRAVFLPTSVAFRSGWWLLLLLPPTWKSHGRVMAAMDGSLFGHWVFHSSQSALDNNGSSSWCNRCVLRWENLMWLPWCSSWPNPLDFTLQFRGSGVLKRELSQKARETKKAPAIESPFFTLSKNIEKLSKACKQINAGSFEGWYLKMMRYSYTKAWWARSWEIWSMARIGLTSENLLEDLRRIGLKPLGSSSSFPDADCCIKLMTLMTCFDREKESCLSDGRSILMKFMDRILHQLISSLSMSTNRMFTYYSNRFARFCSSSPGTDGHWVNSKTLESSDSTLSSTSSRGLVIFHIVHRPAVTWERDIVTQGGLWKPWQEQCEHAQNPGEPNFNSTSEQFHLWSFSGCSSLLTVSMSFLPRILRSGLTHNGNRTPGATVLPKSTWRWNKQDQQGSLWQRMHLRSSKPKKNQIVTSPLQNPFFCVDHPKSGPTVGHPKNLKVKKWTPFLSAE